MLFPLAPHITIGSDHLRNTCDFMHAFFVLDDYTDALDAVSTKSLFDATMDAMENPDKARPQGETILGEMFRQYEDRRLPRHL